MKQAKTDRTKIRSTILAIPMSKDEQESVESAARKEGMTKAAYSRVVFGAVTSIPLSKFMMAVENVKES